MRLGLLEGEEPLLCLEATGESLERAALCDDAVAGDDDRVGILSAGGSGGAEGFRSSDSARQLTVGDGLAEGNPRELLPDFALEFGAFGVKRHGEVLALAGEEILEFTRGFLQHGMRRVAGPFLERGGDVIAAREE